MKACIFKCMYVYMYVFMHVSYLYTQAKRQQSISWGAQEYGLQKKSFLSQCIIIFNISTQRQRQADFYEVEVSLVYKVG